MRFRISGLESTIYGNGLWLRFRFEVSDFGFRVQGVGFRV